jgi:Lon protease-like protein
MNEQQDPLADFSGMVRLFPLPNLVLFPHVLQPLHIFEPRYREMTRDALDGDHLIAMALLQPDWEEQYLDRPPIFPLVCLCKIVAEQALEDGRFNILIRGLTRARIVREVDSDKLYRQARVELLADVPLKDRQQVREFRKELLDLVPDWFPDQPAVLAEFSKLLKSNISLGMLCDIITFALPLPVEFKQMMLAEADVERRATDLRERLAARKNRRFPPDFSSN